MNTLTTSVYRKISIEENLKFYKPIKKICVENKINDYEQYIGLFFLRRFPGIILNETNNLFLVEFYIGHEILSMLLKNFMFMKDCKINQLFLIPDTNVS